MMAILKLLLYLHNIVVNQFHLPTIHRPTWPSFTFKLMIMWRELDLNWNIRLAVSYAPLKYQLLIFNLEFELKTQQFQICEVSKVFSLILGFQKIKYVCGSLLFNPQIFLTFVQKITNKSYFTANQFWFSDQGKVGIFY